MAEVKPEADLPDLGRKWLRWPARWRWRVSLVLLALIVVVGAFAWGSREQIAANLIETTLADYGLEATYEIETIGARRQVIRNLVVGDPALPDFTAERVVLDISYTYGPPQLGRIEVTGPRLYGEVSEAGLSFGSLDGVLFAPSDEPAGLPELDVKVIDGRARISSQFGVIGIKLDGEGALDDGFAGKLAATAPGLGVEGCGAQTLSAYGDLTSEAGRLQFDGPLRVRDLACEGARIASADVGAVLSLSEDLAMVEGDLALDASGLSFDDVRMAKLGGEADFALSLGEGQEFSLQHNLGGEQLSLGLAKVAEVASEGTLRSSNGFARSEWAGQVTGDGIDASGLVDAVGLSAAREAGEGTLVGALAAKLERGLTGALTDGAFAADASVRTTSDTLRVVIPEARLSNGSGETVLAMSRVSYASASGGSGGGSDGGSGGGAGGDQPEVLSGNILTGGTDLPRINARVEQRGGGALALRMRMAPYVDGGDRVSIPRLEARRDGLGNVRFDGIMLGEGAVPGGAIKGLEVPIEGRWSSGSGLALGTQCSKVRLAGLNAYDFELRRQNVEICPQGGKAMVSYREDLRIAAQLGELSLTGLSGGSPATIAATSASLSYPGGFALAGLEAKIGAPGNAVRFDAAAIDGELGETIGGQITGANAALDLVPIDLSDISGTWSFADNAFTLDEGAFTLTERGEAGALPRLEPLAGREAALTFLDGKLDASAQVYHPLTLRNVANIAIRHDLSSARGNADIMVPALRFDEGFQPDDLTPLTKGLIAFVDGVITGKGRVDWEADSLTSSGTFSSDGFDFAAAFGPVRGLAGTIEFTDLLAMTTAPAQVATIASVNPGIEVLEGRVAYSITDGTLIQVDSGRWPFMGGELILRPVTLDYGGGQGQSYIFEIVALDAATFVTQMELTNLGASGRFDGTIPIIFDAAGNGTIQGGLLISRPSGGNVSYVGELTYEDLGTISNYAFQTLRSLDYNQMSIELNGNLAGEIVTNFNIDGVRQGEGTSQNFITRQLAQLPIRFKINVRSENFYLLSQVVQGFFDPSVFDREDVRETLGIGALDPVEDPEDPTQDFTPTNEAQRRNEPAVQPSESEDPL